MYHIWVPLFAHVKVFYSDNEYPKGIHRTISTPSIILAYIVGQNWTEIVLLIYKKNDIYSSLWELSLLSGGYPP